MGAAFLAGLAVGFWSSTSELKHKSGTDKTFIPSISDEKRDELYTGWQKAVSQTINT